MAGMARLAELRKRNAPQPYSIFVPIACALIWLTA